MLIPSRKVSTRIRTSPVGVNAATSVNAAINRGGDGEFQMALVSVVLQLKDDRTLGLQRMIASLPPSCEILLQLNVMLFIQLRVPMMKPKSQMNENVLFYLPAH